MKEVILHCLKFFFIIVITVGIIPAIYFFPVDYVWQFLHECIAYLWFGTPNYYLIGGIALCSAIIGGILFWYRDSAEEGIKAGWCLDFSIPVCVLAITIYLTNNPNYSDINWFSSAITRGCSFFIVLLSAGILIDSVRHGIGGLLANLLLMAAIIIFIIATLYLIGCIISAFFILDVIGYCFSSSGNSSYIGSFRDRHGNMWDAYLK